MIPTSHETPLFLNWRYQPYWPDLHRQFGVSETGAATLISLSTAQGAVSYSRNRNYYTAPPRYRSKLFTYAKVTQAADFIGGQGYAHHIKVPPGNWGVQSSLRIKDAARERVMSIIAAGPTLEAVPPPETIILRNADGAPVQYSDTTKIRTMRHRLAEINEAIRSAYITGVIPDAMVRIFNKSFNRGGRFYALGGSWQSMSKAARQQIQINGEPVVEIDFKTLHPALLYAQAGARMPEDCYQIDGWPRPLVKQAFLVLINARTERDARASIARHDAIAPIARPGSTDAHAAASRIIADIKSRHSQIAAAFHSDMGAELMRADGDMAELIMHMMLRAGIVVLPVHDSFLVQRSRADELERTMLQVAHEAGYECLRVERS